VAAGSAKPLRRLHGPPRSEFLDVCGFGLALRMILGAGLFGVALEKHARTVATFLRPVGQLGRILPMRKRGKTGRIASRNRTTGRKLPSESVPIVPTPVRDLPDVDEMPLHPAEAAALEAVIAAAASLVVARYALDESVRNARDAGLAWMPIAQATGLSRDGARFRWGRSR
jgi:hypothetical protein